MRAAAGGAGGQRVAEIDAGGGVDHDLASQVILQTLQGSLVGRLDDGQHADIRLAGGFSIFEAADSIETKGSVQLSGHPLGFFLLARADEDGVSGVRPADCQARAFFAGAAEDGDGGQG